MKILLDEDVSHPLLDPLCWLLREHQIDRALDIGWQGTKDPQVYAKAKRHGYELMLTNDSHQLADDKICKAIHRSKLHVVFYDLPSHNGLAAHGASAGAIMHTMRHVLEELGGARSQQIVTITPLKNPGNNYIVQDPNVEEVSKYWPGRRQYDRHHPPRRRKR